MEAQSEPAAPMGGSSVFDVRRREFIILFGGAAASWPLTARAQQTAMPVVGFLNFTSPDGFESSVRAFRQGLKETGYVEGENVAIENRWADNQMARMPELASQLVHRKVALIAAVGTTSALTAKAATTTIPIVFATGGDPVRLGLVTNLARPDGNLTGISFLASEVSAKRLELLRELLPGATRVAVLVNRDNAALAESTVQDVEVAARAIGMRIQVFNASTGPSPIRIVAILRSAETARSTCAHMERKRWTIRFHPRGGLCSRRAPPRSRPLSPPRSRNRLRR
jgi:putative tryptophan/tyrosine transport system substrate-binding protein